MRGLIGQHVVRCDSLPHGVFRRDVPHGGGCINDMVHVLHQSCDVLLSQCAQPHSIICADIYCVRRESVCILNYERADVFGEVCVPVGFKCQQHIREGFWACPYEEVTRAHRAPSFNMCNVIEGHLNCSARGLHLVGSLCDSLVYYNSCSPNEKDSNVYRTSCMGVDEYVGV